MQNGQRKARFSNRAYVLINVDVDKATEVANKLRKDIGLSTVDLINGPYSLIAVVEGRNIAALAKTIIVDIKKISAVRDIVVYMSLPEVEASL